MYKYLKIDNISFPSIDNLKCTRSDRQMYPRLDTPDLDSIHGRVGIFSKHLDESSDVSQCSQFFPCVMLMEIVAAAFLFCEPRTKAGKVSDVLEMVTESFF